MKGPADSGRRVIAPQGLQVDLVNQPRTMTTAPFLARKEFAQNSARCHVAFEPPGSAIAKQCVLRAIEDSLQQLMVLRQLLGIPERQFMP